MIDLITRVPLIFVLCSGPNNITFGDQQGEKAAVLPPEQAAAIDLPASLFRNIDNRSSIGLFFALYDNSTLFPVGNRNSDATGLLQTQVGSSILATTVGPGIAFDNLEENVTVTLRIFTSAEVIVVNITQFTVLAGYNNSLLISSHIKCFTWNLHDW